MAWSEENKFYIELKAMLPASTTESRRRIAARVVEENMDFTRLADLMQCAEPIPTRFLWLMAELGELYPQVLMENLPYLFKVVQPGGNLKWAGTFANFWQICGVPEENESEAIDLLFSWLDSPETTVTLKSRSARVLMKLAGKYPELKNELRLVLERQMDRNSRTFYRLSKRIIDEL